jgi:hypothetical protein
MKSEEKAVAVGLFAAVVGYAIYDNYIKDPNVKLEEKYLHRMHASNTNLEFGMMLNQQEANEKSKVKTYLHSLGQLNDEQKKLLASL